MLFEHTVRYYHHLQVYDMNEVKRFPKTKLDKNAVVVLRFKVMLRVVGCLCLNEYVVKRSIAKLQQRSPSRCKKSVSRSALSDGHACL